MGGGNDEREQTLNQILTEPGLHFTAMNEGCVGAGGGGGGWQKPFTRRYSVNLPRKWMALKVSVSLFGAC